MNDLKKYQKPLIEEENIQLEDIIALSGAGTHSFDDSDEVFPGGKA